jgi:hypothetical protein
MAFDALLPLGGADAPADASLFDLPATWAWCCALCCSPGSRHIVANMLAWCCVRWLLRFARC